MIYVCTCMCVWMYSLVKCECFEHHNRKRPSASSQVIKQHFTYSTRIAYFPIVQRKQYLDIVVFPQKAAFLNSCTSVTELTNIQCEQLPRYMHWYMLLFLYMIICACEREPSKWHNEEVLHWWNAEQHQDLQFQPFWESQCCAFYREYNL